MIEDTIKFIKSKFNNQKLVPLHSPVFIGNEKKYLNECIDTTFVSSVGSFVNTFEINLAKVSKVKHSIAVVNGTAALQIALQLVGVKENDEVMIQ